MGVIVSLCFPVRDRSWFSLIEFGAGLQGGISSMRCVFTVASSLSIAGAIARRDHAYPEPHHELGGAFLPLTNDPAQHVIPRVFFPFFP